MSSKSPVRSAEDIDETALSYAEIKMLATGNPYIKEKMDLDIQVQKLRMLKSNFLSERYSLEDKVLKDFPRDIARYTSRIDGFIKDIATAKHNPKSIANTFVGMIVNGVRYDEKADAGQAIIDVCKTLPDSNTYPLGEYRGFKMEVHYEPFSHKHRVEIKGAISHQGVLGSDPLGNITRIDNVIDGLEKVLENEKAELYNTQKQLEIAKEIARICEENKINYYLIGGTLLGAIRHKGFIPWDDDLDIGMIRSDYEKFMQIAPKCLDDKYALIDWKSDLNYPHPMGKIIKKGTIYRESKRNDNGNQGIWVDIFPYDYTSGIGKDFAKKTFKLKVLRSLVRAKCNYQTWQSGEGIILSKYIKNLPFRLAAIFLKKETLVEKYEMLCVEDENLKYLYENGTEDYEKWCFPREYFIEQTRAEFKGYYFSIPQKYDEYLRRAYGEYMELPPENERENRHLIEEINFGE